MEIAFLFVLLAITAASAVSIVLLVRNNSASPEALRLQKLRATRAQAPFRGPAPTDEPRPPADAPDKDGRTD